jgi:hypothetical protein
MQATIITQASNKIKFFRVIVTSIFLFYFLNLLAAGQSEK